MKHLCIVPFAIVMSSAAFAGDVSAISTEDYHGAAYYQTALEHPKVAAQKTERQKLALVAKDLGWPPKKLAAAVEKVRALEGDPIELAKRALEEGFSESRVKDRVLDVMFNVSEPKHVVCYVRWRGSRGLDAVKEASAIAHVVAERAPFVSTLSLAAIHPKASPESTASVWQAKIARTAMTRISPSRIDGFADRLYKPMFEGLKDLPF